MRIVNYQEFINLPQGTLYRETEPQIFGELQIKQETINEGHDWYLTRLDYFQTELSFSDGYEFLEAGNSLPLDLNSSERDGMFDYERKFLIYEKEDVKALMEYLTELI